MVAITVSCAPSSNNCCSYRSKPAIETRRKQGGTRSFGGTYHQGILQSCNGNRTIHRHKHDEANVCARYRAIQRHRLPKPGPVLWTRCQETWDRLHDEPKLSGSSVIVLPKCTIVGLIVIPPKKRSPSCLGCSTVVRGKVLQRRTALLSWYRNYAQVLLV